MTTSQNDNVYPFKNNAPQKTMSQWREAYPNFADLCFKDQEISLALRYAFSWSQFFLGYLTRDLNASGKFFTRMGISEPSARSIIAESVDAGYVVETFWRQDQRVKMLFLTTEMMKSWLNHCAFLMFDFIKEADLPEMREEIEAAGEGFFERVLQKIETSMQQDQKLSQN